MTATHAYQQQDAASNSTHPATLAPTKELKDALLRAAAIAPARSSNPLLTNMLLESKSGTLTIRSTNLNIDWEECIKAPELPDFTTLVNAKKLAQIAALLSSDETPLGLDAHQNLQLYAAEPDMLFTLIASSGDAALYPESYSARTPTHSVPARELATAWKTVLYAMSNAAFQAVFRGACFAPRPEDGLTEVVTSDGYRVAVYRLSTALPYAIIDQHTLRAILPHLARLPEDAQAEFSIVEGGGSKAPATTLQLKAGSFRVTFKCIEGGFPDYRAVMFNNGLRTAWKRAPLLKRLAGMQIMADHNANNRIELRQVGALLNLRTEGDFGIAQAGLQLETPLGGAGESVTASYNLRHLREAAYHAPTDDLSVTILKPSDPKSFDRRLDLQCGPYRAVMVSLRV